MQILYGGSMKSLFILFLFLPSFCLAQEKLTNSQQWAIALTGIMTESNRHSHTTLTNAPPTESNKNKILLFLKRDWGITNRDELSRIINKMEMNGHNESFKKIVSIIRETEDYSMYNILDKYRLTSKEYNYLTFTVANWSLYKDRSLIVWDLGRNIALCRWAVDVGFFTSEEAWPKIMYYAKKIQPLYSSWKDYGYDYMLGRIFWASGFGSDIEYLIKTEPIYRKLLCENGAWSQIPWNTPLE
jgi:Protein of unknown function (DUF1266)